MFPLGTKGKTDASTTRIPSSPYTRIVAGSTTDPIAQVQEGWSAVSASRATQSRISSSLCTDGPGDTSPPSYGQNAAWARIERATWIASIHSPRSFGVDRELKGRAGCTLGSAVVIFSEPRTSEYIGPTCTWYPCFAAGAEPS